VRTTLKWKVIKQENYMKKQFVAAGVAATIGIAGLGAGVAHAETSTNSSNTDPMSSLVDKIATKFNLNKSDVQQVVDEQRASMESQHEKQVKSDVAQLVKDGKITQAQADAINAKRAEIQKNREANRDTMKDKTDTERKTTMGKERSGLEAWAKQQGIDSQYLRYVVDHVPDGHGGPRGEKPADATDSSSAQ
jgi:competence protein ComGC